MKKLNKNSLKSKLTKINNLLEKVEMKVEEIEHYSIGDANNISDDELDKRVLNFYNFIEQDYELYLLLNEIKMKIKRIDI